MNTNDKRQTQVSKRPASVAATNLEEIQRRRRHRNLRANVITVVMIMASLGMLAYIAWQLANPVTIYVSKVLGGR